MTEKDFIKRAREMNTLVSKDRLRVLYNFCRATEGEIWECGVYKGGTANAFAGFNRTLRLFDTFEGMPETSRFDNYHKKGDFDVDNVPQIYNAKIYQGMIPETFTGLSGCEIGFAHIDVDIYQSVIDCCEFIVPRLNGIMVFDDYGFNTCKGAKRACDDFFGNAIIPLSTRQAVYVSAGNKIFNKLRHL